LLDAQPGKFRKEETNMSHTISPISEPGAPAAPAWQGFRKHRHSAPAAPFRFSALTYMQDEETAHRQAELFYLQKQIQSQTPMVIVLEDGEQVEGCIEWYDRHTLKVRGRYRMLVFKSAIKFMYKQGENGA
ncbi:MAG: RNA chaperone Hfq, partial [Bryobacteraceae bacterium]